MTFFLCMSFVILVRGIFWPFRGDVLSGFYVRRCRSKGDLRTSKTQLPRAQVLYRAYLERAGERLGMVCGSVALGASSNRNQRFVAVR